MKLSNFALLLPVTSLAFQPQCVRPSRSRVVCHSSSNNNNSKKKKKGLELPQAFNVGNFFEQAEQARDELNQAQTSMSSSTSSSTNVASSNDNNNNQLDQLRGRFDEFRNRLSSTSSFDFSKIMDSSDAIRENVLSGELGQRGESYVLAQFSLVAFIAAGSIPVVGDLVTIVLGPGLLVAGLVIMVMAVQDMGGSLSPWPVPNENTELITDGVFGSVRHPIYAGLLASLLGWSLVTGSALRLLLTVALWYVLEVKSTYEEEQLQQTFPGQYAAYTKQVPGKFFPSAWSLDVLMSFWNQQTGDDKP